MNTKYRWDNIDWVNTLFLFLTPIAAVASTIWWLKTEGFDWHQLIVALVFYVLGGISITAGYHRLFSHRAYQANYFVKLFFLCFGASTFQNSVLKWGSDHRIHHNKVDTPEDPYNIHEGFFHAHMGWILLKTSSGIDEKYARDLIQDKLVMFQHRFYLPLAIFFGAVLPVLAGWYFCGSWLGALALACLWKLVLIHHCTFFINSLCHCWGTTPYTDTNTAKDSWYMALFTFGEGYHNFHHYFQTDFRNGIRWYQFDPTKWLIKSMAWLGLSKKLIVVPEEKIVEARLKMSLKALQSKKISSRQWNEMDELHKKVVACMERVTAFKKDMQEMKKRRDLKVEEIKANYRQAKLELKQALEEWRSQLTLVNA